jgi:hypothetical protein
MLVRQEPDVRGNDVADPQFDQVAGHQLGRGDGPGLTVADDAGLRGQPRLQRGDRAVGLGLVPEADAAVDQQHHQDDAELLPAAGHAGEHQGDFQHPGDRPPEVRQQLHQRVGLFPLDLVLAVAGQALPGLLGGKAPFDVAAKTRRKLGHAFRTDPLPGAVRHGAQAPP